MQLCLKGLFNLMLREAPRSTLIVLILQAWESSVLISGSPSQDCQVSNVNLANHSTVAVEYIDPEGLYPAVIHQCPGSKGTGLVPKPAG